MEIVCRMVFGSHLYGLNTSKSDTDYKSIYLPTKRELLLGTWKRVIRISGGKNNEKNTSGDIDEEAIALPEFISQACKGETYAIDMLHCTPGCLISSSNIWENLVRHREDFYSRDMKAYIGYLKKQVAKYGIKAGRYAAIKRVAMEVEKYLGTIVEVVRDKLPNDQYCSLVVRDVPNRGEVRYYSICGSLHEESISTDELYCRVSLMIEGYGARVALAERNEGIDWKAVSHALRAGYQLRDIFVQGDFKYPLSETEFILQVKKGGLNFIEEVCPVLDELLEELEELSLNSLLPQKIDTSFWDNYLLSIYDTYVLNT